MLLKLQIAHSVMSLILALHKLWRLSTKPKHYLYMEDIICTLLVDFTAVYMARRSIQKLSKDLVITKFPGQADFSGAMCMPNQIKSKDLYMENNGF